MYTFRHHLSECVDAGGPVGIGYGRQTLDIHLLDSSLDPHPQSFLLCGEGAAGTKLGLRCPAGARDADCIGEVTHTQLAVHPPPPWGRNEGQLPRYQGYISWEPKA